MGATAAKGDEEAMTDNLNDTGSISDGYHTFDELYEHRHALFLVLMSKCREQSWFSVQHHDGTSMKGWFIAGIALPSGQVTYPLPERLWDAAIATGARCAGRGEAWDGHTPADVVDRLMAHADVRPVAPVVRIVPRTERQ